MTSRQTNDAATRPAREMASASAGPLVGSSSSSSLPGFIFKYQGGHQDQHQHGRPAFSPSVSRDGDDGAGEGACEDDPELSSSRHASSSSYSQKIPFLEAHGLEEARARRSQPRSTMATIAHHPPPASSSSSSSSSSFSSAGHLPTHLYQASDRPYPPSPSPPLLPTHLRRRPGLPVRKLLALRRAAPLLLFAGGASVLVALYIFLLGAAPGSSTWRTVSRPWRWKWPSSSSTTTFSDHLSSLDLPPPPQPFVWSGGEPLRPPPIMAHSLFFGKAGGTADGSGNKCLEAWVARGETCPALDLSRAKMLDAVWAWVNGSEPRHRSSRSFWSNKPVNYSIVHLPQGSPSPSQSPREASPSHADDRRLEKRLSGHRPGIQPPVSNNEPGSPNSDGNVAKMDEKWFRDHDELRYSFRSIYQHMGPYIRTSHIVAGDFAHPYVSPHYLEATNGSTTEIHDPTADDKGRVDPGRVGFTDLFPAVPSSTVGDEGAAVGWRAGQWPQWLDAESEWTRTRQGSTDGSGFGGVRIHHHWTLFSIPPPLRDSAPPPAPEGERDEEEERWKDSVLPTFNSFAIEAQMANIPDLGENFIYNNDDFFLTSDLTVSDFVTPLYGSVFRMQGNFRVDPVANSMANPKGEWPQLQRSSFVLGERFGGRKRPYIAHVTKTFSTPLLQEARLMFPSAFAATASHRFRGKGHDTVAVFLANHMTVERHREALLWSFLVAKGDANADGYLDRQEMAALLAVMKDGLADGQSQKPVTMPHRMTLRDDRHVQKLRKARLPAPRETKYRFSSRDGYPFLRRLSPQTIDKKTHWPDVSLSSKPELCILRLDQCFPEAYYATDDSTDPAKGKGKGKSYVWASDVFKRFAFDKFECGDCLVYHLMSLSGNYGLEAFLPPRESSFPVNESMSVPDGIEPTPFLPLGPTWRPLDFSLANVAASTGWPGQSRREFAMRLIHRYSYILGESPTTFIALEFPRQVTTEFAKLTKAHSVFVCVNDDISKGRERIENMFSHWLRTSFPTPLPNEIV